MIFKPHYHKQPSVRKRLMPLGHRGVLFSSCYIFTPKKYPTNTVSPIAMVPKKVIRMIAFPIFEPPVLVANAPKQ